MNSKTERALKSAAASSRMEGYTVTPCHIETAKQILNGTMTMAEYFEKLKAKAEKH